MKKHDRYSKYINATLNLTDQFAASRSILANERTFLSYQRTSITIFVAGVTLIRFFTFEWIEIVGWIFLPISLLTITLGIYRYQKMCKMILELGVDVSDKANEFSLIEKRSETKIIK